ncbi:MULTISPECIES: TIGR04104 family putative zinc finger protein [Bacillus]|uniref:TIGR04104 family putative zinc finger protein n=1 Tax=Bacillus TaxID=1386 RepID=UPI0009E698D0
MEAVLIPTCQNCGYKWSWRETFVKMFTLSNKLKCPSCEAFQYVSKKSRNQLGLFVFIDKIFSPPQCCELTIKLVTKPSFKHALYLPL